MCRTRARRTGFYSGVGVPLATRLRPFGLDRNICSFLWYGGVAGDGLRSVGKEALPSTKSVCSILPSAICGPGLSGSGLYTVLGRPFVTTHVGAALALCPLCVARGLG